MNRTKQTKPEFRFNPFKSLKGLIKANKIAVQEKTSKVSQSEDITENEERECANQIFLDAVADVKPLSSQEYEKRSLPVQLPPDFPSEEEECVRKLKELINHGRGFVISDTQEYIEGTGYNVHSTLASRLHQGEFAVQGHIDLHGFLPSDAGEVFDGFMKKALMKGWRTVLVIHGRGLSSPDEPVLKNKVVEWLQSHRWRKWVIAYSSARSCDGGTGATYILLRHRSYSKHGRKPEQK